MLVGRKYLDEAHAVHTAIGTELEAPNYTWECRVCRPIFPPRPRRRGIVL